MVSLDVQTENLVESLADVEAEEVRLRTQLQEARTRGAILESVTGIETLERAYASVRVGQNEAIAEIESQLTEAESLVAQTQSILGSRHPDMVELMARREELRGLYQQQVSRFIPAGGEQSQPKSGRGRQPEAGL